MLRRWGVDGDQMGAEVANDRELVRPSHGGDRRSGWIEAVGDEILDLVDRRPDITLAEIAAHLEETHGMRPALSTVHGFFKRRGISWKKRQRTRPSKTEPT